MASISIPPALLTAQGLRWHILHPRFVVVDPKLSLGKQFPLLDYVDPAARADLENGRRTIILINHDCETCKKYLSDFASQARSKEENARIRVIDITPVPPGTPNIGPPQLREVHLRMGVLYVAPVPLEVSLSGGVVGAARHVE